MSSRWTACVAKAGQTQGAELGRAEETMSLGAAEDMRRMDVRQGGGRAITAVGWGGGAQPNACTRLRGRLSHYGTGL